jgi:hypothetical protein
VEGNHGSRDAAVGISLGELRWIAKDERRCQYVGCLTSALSGGDVH